MKSRNSVAMKQGRNVYGIPLRDVCSDLTTSRTLRVCLLCLCSAPIVSIVGRATCWRELTK